MHTMNRKDCAESLQKCVEHSEKMDRTTVIFYNSEVEEIIRQLHFGRIRANKFYVFEITNLLFRN